jgi:hypothetical protein
MKPTVYVETSVIGYLTSWPSGDLVVAARQKITHDWWRDAPGKYELTVSERVVSEASTGDPQAVQDRLKAIQGLPILPVTHEAESLANALMTQGAIPITEPEDALHIAVTVVNGVEYLVTWNFKHIANAAMRRKVNSVITAAGYVPATICTPEELSGAQP